MKTFLFMLAAVSTFSLYFIGLNTASHPAEKISLLAKTAKAILFFFVYMGANFIPTYRLGQFTYAVIGSCAIFGLFLLAGGLWLQAKSWNSGLSGKIVPYSLMWIGIGQAVMTAIGRSGDSLRYAMLSRYHAFQMLYFFGFIWLLLTFLINKNMLHKYARLLLSLFVLLLVSNWISGIALGFYKMRKFYPVEVELKNKAENIRSEYANMIYNDQKMLRQRIIMLKEMKYNVFSN